MGYGHSYPVAELPGTDYHNQAAFVELNTLLDMLGLKKVWLFGHSDGGTISLLCASMNTQRIEGVITLSAHVFVDDFTRTAIQSTVDDHLQTKLLERLRKYHGDKTEMVFHTWKENWLSPAFSDWNITRKLTSIVCPVLVIQGEKDEYGKLDQVDAILQNCSGFTQKVILDCNHWPHQTQKERTLLAFERFIKNPSFFQAGSS
jgi:pimeloyl-ACP methyl ester carboxylesterase